MRDCQSKLMSSTTQAPSLITQLKIHGHSYSGNISIITVEICLFWEPPPSIYRSSIKNSWKPISIYKHAASGRAPLVTLSQ